MRALVAGATGLIGQALLPQLEEAVVLTRHPSSGQFHWDAEVGPPAAETFRNVDVVFNFAGESIAAGRWTPQRKRRIFNSRVLGTRHLVAGMASLASKPKLLINASAVGYYGDRGDEALDERSSAGHGFLADVCVNWEREALAASQLGVRVICARFGVVLARRGGALEKMLPPFKLGVGGRLGDGKQWMPWVHLHDAIGLLLHAARHPAAHGPLNVVAPQLATNGEFTKVLATAVHRWAPFPVPKAALKLALGEMSEMVLASHRVAPKLAQELGYSYRFPNLAAALQDILPQP